MPLDWTSIEDVLHAWLVRGTGLSAERVLWAEQLPPRLTRPFATLKLGALTRTGGADELRESTDLDAPDGEEIEFTAVGQRLLVVSCQAFTQDITGGAAARALLARAQAALALPSVTEAFAGAGLVVVNEGGINDLTALLDTQFEGRAQMDVTFALAGSVTERTGYIAEAEIAEDTTE